MRAKVNELENIIAISLNVSRKLDIVVAIPIVTRTMYEIMINKMPAKEFLSCIKGKNSVYLKYV